MIYANFEKNENKMWVNDLQKLVYSYNHSKHSTTSKRPVELLQGSKEDVKKLNIELEKKRKRKTDEALEKFNEKPLKYGDLVRINRSIYPHVRKELLLYGKRSFVQKWSSETYTIIKVLRPRIPGRVHEYMVDGLRYKFKQNQLLKIEKPDRPLKKAKQ